jgi:hypothetical protein
LPIRKGDDANAAGSQWRLAVCVTQEEGHKDMRATSAIYARESPEASRFPDESEKQDEDRFGLDALVDDPDWL